MSKSQSFTAVAICLNAILIGCSGSDDTSTPDLANPKVNVSGKVLAPGGTVAFNPPVGIEKFFSGLIGSAVVADIEGTVAVAGASVKVIEIDSSGNQIGDALGSATTAADGSYTIDLPVDFVAASNYVVRASGSGGAELDAIVMSTDDSVDVDPLSDAVFQLALTTIAANTGTALTDIDVSELVQIHDEVAALESEIEFNGASNADAFVTAIKQEALANEDVFNMVNSAVEASEICGKVTDSSGAALKNIVVTALDFGDWVTRAKVRTNKAGEYCMSVPANRDYILGALNFTNLSTAGSEWWTCDDTATTLCGTAVRLDAAKISVQDSKLLRNFVLEPGVRIEGTVKTTSNAALKRVNLLLRTMDSDIATFSRRTSNDGIYRINMRPGIYKMFASNHTRQHFATQAYNQALQGGLNFHEAEKIDISSADKLGTTVGANFSLEPGFPVAGILKDENNNPIAGVRVQFRQDGTVDVIRTNKAGLFRLQLRPGIYQVMTHGQQKTVMLPKDILAQSSIYDVTDMPLVFNKAVGSVKVKLKQACGTADEHDVSQAKVMLYKGQTLFAIEASNSDGSSEVHINTSDLTDAVNSNTPVRLVVRVEDGKYAGSIVFKDNVGTDSDYAYRFAAGTDLSSQINSATDKALDLGSLCLPAAGIVSGTVTTRGGEPMMNANIQILDCSGANGCAYPNIQLTSTRSNANGEYQVSLPAGMVAGVRVQVGRAKGDWSNRSTPVTIVAGQKHTVDMSVDLPDPVGLYAEAGNQSATIYWKKVPGASSYNVYMSQQAGVGVTDDASGSWMKHSTNSSSFVQGSLTNGTKYYFVVTALDVQSNESTVSEEIMVIPTID